MGRGSLFGDAKKTHVSTPSRWQKPHFWKMLLTLVSTFALHSNIPIICKVTLKNHTVFFQKKKIIDLSHQHHQQKGDWSDFFCYIVFRWSSRTSGLVDQIWPQCRTSDLPQFVNINKKHACTIHRWRGCLNHGFAVVGFEPTDDFSSVSKKNRLAFSVSWWTIPSIFVLWKGSLAIQVNEHQRFSVIQCHLRKKKEHVHLKFKNFAHQSHWYFLFFLRDDDDLSVFCWLVNYALL